MSDLGLRELNRISSARCARWNGGNPAPLDFAMMELAGEVGEACNAAKKLARLERGWPGGVDTREQLAQELADVVICADLAAQKAGIDLAKAVVEKFNATSEKHGFPERLELSPEGKSDEQAAKEQVAKIAAEEIAALRDRVAELEAALQGVENNVTLGWRTRSWIRSQRRTVPK